MADDRDIAPAAAPAGRVPILMYHSIGGSDRLAVRPEAFAEQLAYLAEHGFAPLTFGDLVRRTFDPARRPGLPARPVVLTFDDGYADFHERALPLLDRFGFPATLFVTTGWLRDAGPYAAGRPLSPTLAWGQIQEIAAAGVEIGGHGHSHAQLDQLGDRVLGEELRLSRRLLEDRLGRAVPTMAFPYGYSSARVRRAVRAAGYDAACAVANRVAGAGCDVLAVPRLTVRARTSIAGFGRALQGRGFLTDHALTRAYAVVRRSRRAARRLRGAP